MITKSPLFYTAAAVAFLTATPMLANGGFLALPPNMQFAEEMQQPTRNAATLLPTCENHVEGKEACQAEIKQALIKPAKTDN